MQKLQNWHFLPTFLPRFQPLGQTLNIKTPTERSEKSALYCSSMGHFFRGDRNSDVTNPVFLSFTHKYSEYILTMIVWRIWYVNFGGNWARVERENPSDQLHAGLIKGLARFRLMAGAMATQIAARVTSTVFAPRPPCTPIWQSSYILCHCC